MGLKISKRYSYVVFIICQPNFMRALATIEYSTDGYFTVSFWDFEILTLESMEKS